MKSPLSYQITEFDCGPTCIYNSIKYLLNREEIPAFLIKMIMSYCLDEKDDEKNACQGGTSRKKMKQLCEKLNKLDLKIKFDYIEKSSVSLETLKNQLKKEESCIILRTFLDEYEHYILITNYQNNKFYIFDPYYNKHHKRKIKNIFSYNEIINQNILNKNSRENYALGTIDRREAIVVKYK